jgi:arsenite methyltransferase
MTTQITTQVDTLRREIQAKYSEVAENPDQIFHFHHGRPLAEILGYPMDQVSLMPGSAVEAFAGVGNPFSLGPLEPGEAVLDLGSGGGFDCFIAAGMVGPQGKATGVDMTQAMLDRSRATVRGDGLGSA